MSFSWVGGHVDPRDVGVPGAAEQNGRRVAASLATPLIIHEVDGLQHVGEILHGHPRGRQVHIRDEENIVASLHLQHEAVLGLALRDLLDCANMIIALLIFKLL